MAKPQKLPSGNWRVRAYVGTDSSGKKIMKSFTAPTKKEVEYMAAAFLAERKEAPADLTVGKAIDKYIESKSNVLSPTTLRSYKTMRKNYFQNIMDVKLRDITRQAIQLEVNDLATQLSPKSVINANGLLRAALSVYAPDLNLNNITLPKRQKKIRTMPEAADVLKAIQGTSVELPCMLAIWFGMRMSEIRGVKKSDCENGKMIVYRTKVYAEKQNIVREQTKTYDSTRAYNIPPYIQKLIDAVDTEYLTELTRDQIYTRFKKILAANDIKPLISFHDLRHLNASVMVLLGIPDKYAMERGGWSTNSTLRNVYQHTFSDEREAMDRKIDEYFEGLIEE